MQNILGTSSDEVSTSRIIWTKVATIIGLTMLLLTNVCAVGQTESPCGQTDIAQVEVPPDFLIEYQTGRSLKGNVDSLEVNSAGEVIVSNNVNGVMVEDGLKIFKISKDRVKKIYAQVLACDFFRMQDYYGNRRIIDGRGKSLKSLEVKAKGVKRRVIVRNISVPKFDSIVRVLNGETACICHPGPIAVTKPSTHARPKARRAPSTWRTPAPKPSLMI